jgi:predicted molibdopterin-dependent oxidoreductase YjgC
MYIMGENPMLSDPDLKHVEESIAALDFLVVQDIFLTETAKMADVVLPAASFAEKVGSYTNTERRVQKSFKVIDPPGEARGDWEIVADLATMMGYEMKYEDADEILKEISSVTPQYGGISMERIKDVGLQWPCPTPDHPGTRFLHKDKFSRGKGLFHAIEFIAPDEEPDKQYPLILTTGRVIYHFHTGTMTRKSRGLETLCPEAELEINPEDAKALKVENEDRVTVSSRRGSVTAKARVTDRVGKGVVFLPVHFAEAAANRLTNPVTDPVSKIPEYKVCAVRVEKESPKKKETSKEKAQARA